MLRKPLMLVLPLLLAALALLPTAAEAQSSGPGVQVTMPPVGLSIEYPLLAQYLGTGACPPPALVAQLLQLGSPPLALAGASQDLTSPGGGAPAGPGPSWAASTLYSLPASFWSQLHCLLTAAKDHLTAGLNLKTGQLSWATQMVASAEGAATNGLDFSLGNEPDIYELPNYADLGNKLSTQEDLAAINLYLQLAAILRPAIGSLPLIGPELAAAKHWQNQLPGVLVQLHDQTVGVHLYPFSACKDPRAATIKNLLSASAGESPRSLAWVVADATAAGVPAIISEANSVSCGGMPGVSNSPASAVWAMRFVLSALKTGFREVRFHLSGGSYDPFVVEGEAIVNRPLESALVALNQWLPIGSSLRTVSSAKGLVTTAVSSDPAGPALILDNESARARTVKLPAAHALAIEVLSAARTGLLKATLPARHGRVKLRLAPNSVVAVMS
jgi:hypothetical protein